MKKIVSMISALALALGVNAVNVLADEASVPGLVYNGDIKKIEDIKNVEGRVMLPFRAVFEMMGADVDYYEEDSRVTAVRGDKNIEFFVGGKSIKVTDTQGTREIAADIGFDYEKDRVMVPVRFVSNALGARVGWNDSEKCVYVLDTYPMVQSIKTDCDSFYKYCQSAVAMEKNIKSNADISIDFSGKFDGKEVKVGLNGESSAISYNELASGGVNFDFNHENLSERIGYNIKPAQDIKFDAVKNSEAIYFKTNVVSKLAQILPEVSELEMAKTFVGDEDWFKLEYDYVAKQAGKAVADIIFKGVGNDVDTVVKSLEGTFSASNMDIDITEGEMYSVKSYFETLKSMLKEAVYEQIDDDSFTFKLEFDTANWVEILKSQIKREGFASDEEYEALINQISSTMTYKVTVNVAAKDGVIVNETADVQMSINMPENENITFNIKASANSEKVTKTPDIKIPENAVSIASMMNILV